MAALRLELLEEGVFLLVAPRVRGLVAEGAFHVHEKPWIAEETTCGGDCVDMAVFEHFADGVCVEEVPRTHQRDFRKEPPGGRKAFQSILDSLIALPDSPKMDCDKVG